MASRRAQPNLRIDYTSAVEEQAAKFIRGTTPWIVWLGGVPLAATVFSLMAALTHHRALIAGGLWAATAILASVVWHSSHARGWGRLHHLLNVFGSVGWVAAVTAWGWGAGHWILLIAYAICGLLLTLTWNVRYSAHGDGVEDVMKAPKPRGQKAVDLAYVVRVLAGRAPAIRAAAEKAGKVVPAVASPWREGGTQAGIATPLAAIAAPASEEPADAAAVARAQSSWLAIQKNWRDMTARKMPDLNGARLRALDVKPWRIRSEVSLVRGVQIPKAVIDARELLASQNALPPSSIIARPNPRNGSKVFVDWVLEDVLATVRYWPGPAAIGKSIAEAPTRFGLYEDRVFAERFGPAITPELAKRLGRPEKNLSHLLFEGMTGSGKSTAARVLITDGATRLDVEDWLIDTVKKNQTFGHLAQAITWFATTPKEARALVRFLADIVIPARADYLGGNGHDNWEPGCGIPYLRVTIEEGGIIANELEKLDAVLNSARSVGVEIILSAQRVHHALVDTNVRSAFGDTLSFGAKSMEDVFAMSEDLQAAGADPSLWQNKQPGMCYYGASDLDMDRQIMPVRSFNSDARELREIIAEHEPARAAWIAENCPDWAALLARIDAQGIYAKRTTGASVLAQIEAGERKRAGQPAPVQPEAEPEAAPVVHFPVAARLAEDDEVVEGVIVPDGEAGEDPEVNVDELDLDPELEGAVAEDRRIDPRQPVPPLQPGQDLHFGTRPRSDVPRDQALAIVRQYLASKGSGWDFAPRDVYDDLCPATGKSAAWIRSELSSTLVAEGLVEHDRLEGRYTVSAHAA